eukprot:m.192081 g.192081  ORF g.192081 m.192081 type:complete len:84 (-) comp32452_c0_seq6:15-266(-)
MNTDMTTSKHEYKQQPRNSPSTIQHNKKQLRRTPRYQHHTPKPATTIFDSLVMHDIVIDVDIDRAYQSIPTSTRTCTRVRVAS